MTLQAKYFWLGTIIFIISLFVIVPGTEREWYDWVAWFVVCQIGARWIVWRGQKDYEWSDKTSWQRDPFNTEKNKRNPFDGSPPPSGHDGVNHEPR